MPRSGKCQDEEESQGSTSDFRINASRPISGIHHGEEAEQNMLNIKVFVPVARLAATTAVISSQRGHRDLTGPTFKRLLRVTDRISDTVVVNCQAMKRDMVEEEHVPESKVRLCYNAVDTGRYRRKVTQAAFPGRLVVGSISARFRLSVPRRDLMYSCGRLQRCVISGRNFLLLAVVRRNPSCGSSPTSLELQRTATLSPPRPTLWNG